VSGDLLHLPNAATGEGSFVLDLSEVHRLEARKVEVASVTKFKAPELMQQMERGYYVVSTKLMPLVAFQLSQAEQALDARKAVVMLDEAPRILREKGLVTSRNPSGSADQRESVLALDKEYAQLKNTAEMIKAVYELLKGKRHGFEMSFRAIQKSFDSLNQFTRGSQGVPELPEGAGAGDEVDEAGQLKVGAARY
jgi:hypothetical protein